MGALAIHNALLRGMRAKPKVRTYQCRYCHNDGLFWVDFPFGWRLTTDGHTQLHDCPQFSKTRRTQFEKEFRAVNPIRTPSAVKIRASVIRRRVK